MRKIALALHRFLAAVLLPPGFRREYGEEILASVDARLTSKRGTLDLVLVIGLELVDLVWTGAREWWAVAAEEASGRRAGLPSPGFSFLDVKLGLRMLAKHPGLTLVAIFALAIGIPVGLVPAHFVNALQAPLPVEEADRVLALKNLNLATSDWEMSSAQDFVQWREGLTTFEALGVTTMRVSYNVLSEDGRAAPVQGAEVTASAFEILRVQPLLGRTLLPADEVIGAPAVVVIGFELWQSRLEGDPDVLGRAIRIGRVPHTVVGVMPRDFHFPYRDHLWVPMRVDVLAEGSAPTRAQLVFGRLSDGVSLQEAQAELDLVGRRMAVEFPDTHERLKPELLRFTIGFFGLPKRGMQAVPEFYLVQIMALLVLVVACANVGMLIFTRTAARASELAVRTALGASRARVVSQLFTEALVLAVLAAGLGLLLGDAVSRRFDWMENLLPYWVDLGVTSVTVVWAFSLAVFSAAVLGIVPALKVTGKSVQRNIQRAAAGRSGVRFGGVSSALIIADVTLAVVTVGLAVGLADNLTELSDGMGIQADQFLSAEFALPQVEPAGEAVSFDHNEFVAMAGAAQQELVRRLSAEPGVRGVAIGSVLPGMDHRRRRVEVDGENLSEDGEGTWAFVSRVDSEYFTALEQPILAGRGFDLSDLGEDRSAIIVNTGFVDRLFGGRSAIGRRVRYTTSEDAEPGPWYEIVGVVGPLGMNETNPARDAGLYHPLAPGELHPLRFAIHIGENPTSFTPRLRALASQVDPTAIISDPVALDEVRSFNRFTLGWIKVGAVVFTGILLALAASGIYALMSFTVAERTREIGIRTALGAQRNSIVITVARRAFAQLGKGTILGMIIAGRLLFEMKRDMGRLPTHSPLLVTLTVGMGVMVLIGVIACSAPTLRALRIMPTEALRDGG